MNHRLSCVLLVVPFAAALAAQDAPADATPDPKTPAHERLAAFVGTWHTQAKMAAMPGVPGMEEPTEMAGTEHAELICDGLWLQVAGDGTCGGQACSGLWLLGYDPHAGSYQCIAVSNMETAPCCVEGRYDEAAKTWHFQGDSPMGPFRSELVFESADRSVETCHGKDADGKAVEFMRIVRTRADAPVAEAAATKSASDKAAAGAGIPVTLAALHADVGTWDADFRMAMPGAPAMTARCREVVEPICGGTWTWSTFTGEVMGAPFEGHALTGYDREADKVVSFWIDSMNGAFMRTDGTYDDAAKVFTMSGTCYDEHGKRRPVASTATSSGKDARSVRMTFGEGEDQSVMTIAYKRAKD